MHLISSYRPLAFSDNISSSLKKNKFKKWKLYINWNVDSLQGAAADDTGEQNSETESEAEAEAAEAEKSSKKKVTKRRHRETENDEDDWEKFQEESKKENSLETKKRESHPVHCPYFPEVCKVLLYSYCIL